jgi:hypothetical protein
MGKPEERIPLGKPRRRWENDIKIGVSEVELEAWTGSV